MEKVTIVGAGLVGATCANCIAQKDIVNEIVILDIKPGLAEGKALDIWESAPIHSFNTRIRGVTSDYSQTANSDIVVITSGVPRKPGMSRADLISINAGIVKNVTEELLKYSPQTIVLVVSNPLDVMTYAAFLTAKIDSKKVFGMAGILDTARYRSFIAEELNISPNDIEALLLGGHGPSMVPLPRFTTVSGIQITDLIEKKKLEAIVQRTRDGGTEIVKLIGTSAWYAPGAAAAQMVETIVRDQKHIVPVCTFLNGEYGLKNIYLGVPVILGINGVEEIIELQLNEDEKKLLYNSANEVKKVMKELDNLKLF